MNSPVFLWLKSVRWQNYEGIHCIKHEDIINFFKGSKEYNLLKVYSSEKMRYKAYGNITESND